MKILIVEDDKIMRNMLKKSLEKEEFEIIETGNPIEGLKIVKDENPELILLDLIMPEIDGFSFCELVRSFPLKYGNPFIIMLTSKGSEESVLKGLEFGADDYIKKPYSQKELIARINAVMRRGKTIEKDKIIYGDLILDTKMQILSDSRGNFYELYKIEYEIIKHLIINQGLVLTRENIYSEIWKEEFVSGNRTVDNYIWKVKKKVDYLNERILSFRGVGYKLEKLN